MPSLASRCVPCGTCTEWYTWRREKAKRLDAVVTELQRGGIGDRTSATSRPRSGRATGCSSTTSVRADGLFTEVVGRIEEEKRAFLEDGSAPHQSRWPWSCGSGSAIHSYGLRSGCSSSVMPAPARGEEPYASLLPGLVEDWLDRVVALGQARDATDPGSRARVRLSLALFRGLLLIA